jgi:hypothetical protein
MAHRTRMALGLIGIAVLLLALFVYWKRHDAAQVPFQSLEAAIAAGALDPGVVAELNKSGRVRVIAALRFSLPPFVPDPAVRLATDQERWLSAVKQQLNRLKDQVLQRHPGLEPVNRFEHFPLLLLDLTSSNLLLELLNDGLILSIVPDMLNDYLIGESLPLVRGDRARMARVVGAGVAVALIDSGVDTADTAFGTCPSTATSTCRVVASEDIGPDDGALDNVGHGSQMAATILSVAPAASLVVFDAGRTLNGIKDSDAIVALGRVLDLRIAFNIRAVNMSFGHDQGAATTFCSNRDPYVQVLATLRTLGVLPVVASGNSAQSGTTFTNGIDRPACIPGALSVGAVYDSATAATVFTNCTDTVAAPDTVPCLSQSGPNLSMLAPGADITVLGKTIAGTSPAAAFVSGGVASVASFRSGLSAPQIETLLVSNGPNVTDSRNGVTRKRLDVLGSLVAAAAPTPDNFADAKVMTGAVAFAESSNFVATKEPNEPNHAGGTGGASLWFQWTAPYSGTAKISTAGTNFDHVIAVYTGSSVGALTQIAAQSPAIPPTPMPMPAMVTFNVTSGTTFRIAVDGQPIGTLLQRGTARLTINGPPANDMFIAASPVVFNTQVTGQNVGATKEAGETDHCGNDGGASVWYVWQSTVTQTVTAQIGLMGNSCVNVLRSTVNSPTPIPLSQAGLQFVAGGAWSTPDDTFRATFAAAAGEKYFIVVEGMSSEQPPFQAPQVGQFTLVIRP